MALGKLNDAEWEVVRKHPYCRQRILEKVPIFESFASMASSHHEKLDGSGYHRNLLEGELPLPVRILTMADIFDALVADRPYRPGLPIEKVLQIIGEDVPHALDPGCYEALCAALQQPEWGDSVKALQRSV